MVLFYNYWECYFYEDTISYEIPLMGLLKFYILFIIYELGSLMLQS